MPSLSSTDCTAYYQPQRRACLAHLPSADSRRKRFYPDQQATKKKVVGSRGGFGPSLLPIALLRDLINSKRANHPRGDNLTHRSLCITMKRARECCMCGDIGFSRELFRCRKCLHRSQHTYCSVLYPHTESYEMCDWCLRTRQGQKTPSCNISESRCFGKCAAVGAADDGKKGELRGCNDCQRSLPRQHSIRITKQKSMDEAAVLAHCSAQNVPEVASPRGNRAEGREFVLNEGSDTQKMDNIQHGQNRKLDSVGGGCKVVFRMNTKPQMRDAQASTPRPKVRRYKLLEEVSS